MAMPWAPPMDTRGPRVSPPAFTVVSGVEIYRLSRRDIRHAKRKRFMKACLWGELCEQEKKKWIKKKVRFIHVAWNAEKKEAERSPRKRLVWIDPSTRVAQEVVWEKRSRHVFMNAGCRGM